MNRPSCPSYRSGPNCLGQFLSPSGREGVWGCVSLSPVRVRLFATPWAVARQAPLSPPGKNTGVGCHSRLLRFFLTRESNSGLPHCSNIFCWLNYQVITLPIRGAWPKSASPKPEPTPPVPAWVQRCTYQPWPGVAHPTNLQRHHLANQPKLPTPDPIPGRSDRSPSPPHLAKEVLLSVTSPRFQRLPFQFTRSGYSFTTPIPHTQWLLGRGRGPSHTHLSAPHNVARSTRPGS